MASNIFANAQDPIWPLFSFIQFISFYLKPLRSYQLRTTAFPWPFCNALEVLFKSQESAEKAPIARNWLLDLHRHSQKLLHKMFVKPYSQDLLVCSGTLEFCILPSCTNSKISSEVQAKQLLLDKRWELVAANILCFCAGEPKQCFLNICRHFFHCLSFLMATDTFDLQHQLG